MFVIMSYYPDGSGKPDLSFSKENDGSIIFDLLKCVCEAIKYGMEVDVYQVENDSEKLIYSSTVIPKKAHASA